MAIDTSKLIFGSASAGFSDTVVRFAKSTKQFTPRHKMLEYSYDGICLQGIQWDEDFPAMEFKLNWGRIEKAWNGNAGLKRAFSKQLIKSYWSALAKHKGLPKDAIYLRSGRWIRMRDIMKYPPTLLYAYLVNWRHAWEEPAHVCNTMHLANNGMDFWLAYTVSTAISVGTQNHHILPLSGNTSDKGTILNKKLSLNMARKLRKFFAKPSSYDTRRVSSSFHGGWNMHSTIRDIKAVTGSRDSWSIKDILARPAAFSKSVKATSKAAADSAIGKTAVKAPPKKVTSLGDLGYKTLVGYIKGEFRLNARSERLDKRWVVVPMIKTKATANQVVAAVKPFIVNYECKKEMGGWTLRLRRKLKKKGR